MNIGRFASLSSFKVPLPQGGCMQEDVPVVPEFFAEVTEGKDILQKTGKTEEVEGS